LTVVPDDVDPAERVVVARTGGDEQVAHVATVDGGFDDFGLGCREPGGRSD
jgi:hypothetical protein